MPARTLTAALLLVALCALRPSAADQRDPRLDALFSALAHAPGHAQAQAIELRIWAIWGESGDAVVDALLQRGSAAMVDGDIALAIDTFSQVIERAPGFAEGWNKRATARYLNRELAASVADIERTLALEPRHFGAISGMGLIFIERGDLLGALSAFEQVLAIHPRSPSARLQVQRLRAMVRERGA